MRDHVLNGTIDDQRDCWLATTRADGRPHLVPIWFVVDDGTIWIATGATSTKVTNIRNQPQVTIGIARVGPIDNPGDLVIDGTATIFDTAPDTVLNRLDAKYGWRPGPEPDDDIGSVIFIQVTPTRWVMGPGPAVG